MIASRPMARNEGLIHIDKFKRTSLSHISNMLQPSVQFTNNHPSLAKVNIKMSLAISKAKKEKQD
jgi:hypothetical protein